MMIVLMDRNRILMMTLMMIMGNTSKQKAINRTMNRKLTLDL